MKLKSLGELFLYYKTLLLFIYYNNSLNINEITLGYTSANFTIRCVIC